MRDFVCQVLYIVACPFWEHVVLNWFRQNLLFLKQRDYHEQFIVFNKIFLSVKEDFFFQHVSGMLSSVTFPNTYKRNEQLTWAIRNQAKEAKPFFFTQVSIFYVKTSYLPVILTGLLKLV